MENQNNYNTDSPNSVKNINVSAVYSAFSAVTIILLTVLFCAELCRKTFSACFIISNAVFNSQVLCCGNNMRSEKWIKAAAAKTEAMHLPVRGG